MQTELRYLLNRLPNDFRSPQGSVVVLETNHMSKILLALKFAIKRCIKFYNKFLGTHNLNLHNVFMVFVSV